MRSMRKRMTGLLAAAMFLFLGGKRREGDHPRCGFFQWERTGRGA